MRRSNRSRSWKPYSAAASFTFMPVERAAAARTSRSFSTNLEGEGKPAFAAARRIVSYPVPARSTTCLSVAFGGAQHSSASASDRTGDGRCHVATRCHSANASARRLAASLRRTASAFAVSSGVQTSTPASGSRAPWRTACRSTSARCGSRRNKQTAGNRCCTTRSHANRALGSGSRSWTTIASSASGSETTATSSLASDNTGKPPSSGAALDIRSARAGSDSRVRTRTVDYCMCRVENRRLRIGNSQ